MMPKWRKLGRIYSADIALHPKLLSHAANPLPVLLQGNVFRIFFSARDIQNRSSVGAIDFDLVARRLVTVHSEPFFKHGDQGSFFADGVSIGNCYEADGQVYMLFMGWQAPNDGHWRGDIGRISVNDDLQLTLDGSTDYPFMASDAEDPISLSYPWVLPGPKQGFDMWYGSTISWTSGNDEMVHVIKHASSEDGHAWKRNGIAVPFQEGVAQAFSRPSVIRKADGSLEMWFSYRSGTGTPYRIGYAQSFDHGQTWKLALNFAGLSVSEHGWDSEMIEYPYVFEHNGQMYMLYNGNGYGKTGIGLAILEN
ncbi:hypothetical protein [Roseobacter sp. S98]|uniref:hypothetical protein n=1 Tax=Roseobacter algicola (ex Choi et al. 2025) (nom. illeg.) TaxID=3092138 RepID=UPI003F5130AD